MPAASVRNSSPAPMAAGAKAQRSVGPFIMCSMLIETDLISVLEVKRLVEQQYGVSPDLQQVCIMFPADAASQHPQSRTTTELLFGAQQAPRPVYTQVEPVRMSENQVKEDESKKTLSTRIAQMHSIQRSITAHGLAKQRYANQIEHVMTALNSLREQPSAADYISEIENLLMALKYQMFRRDDEIQRNRDMFERMVYLAQVDMCRTNTQHAQAIMDAFNVIGRDRISSISRKLDGLGLIKSRPRQDIPYSCEIRGLARLHQQASAMQPTVNQLVHTLAHACNGKAKVGSLKTVQRCVDKTVQVNGGEFSLLCDVSRASIVFDDAADLEICVDMILSGRITPTSQSLKSAFTATKSPTNSNVEVLGFENGLNPQMIFDMFGQCEMFGCLSLYVSVANSPFPKHICEIQLQYRPLAAVRQSVNVELQELSRAVHMFDDTLRIHVGSVNSPKVKEGISSGIINQLAMDFTPFAQSSEDMLLSSLTSPDCLIHTLTLRGSDVPYASAVQLLCALSMHAHTVRKIDMSGVRMNKGQLTDIPWDIISGFAYLEHMSFADNVISGQISDCFSTLQNLEHLSLEGNMLSGSIPEALGELSNLKRLSLDDNQLTGMLPRSISNLTQLRKFTACRNRFVGGLPEGITHLRALEELRLTSNYLMGDFPDGICGSLSGLQVLCLDNNKFGGVLPSSLGGMRSLLHLSLARNKFEGPLPATLVDLTNLTHLRLGSNRFTGRLPADLKRLVNLCSLELECNAFTGPMPQALEPLVHLSTLHLHDNCLDGQVPSVLGQLNNLSSLKLQQNLFTGTLPLSLCGLSKLRHLWLENNKLSVENSLKRKMRKELPAACDVKL